MTDPDLVSQWFAPRPWTIARVVLDLRPGGRFHVEMRGPDGESEAYAVVAAEDEGGCVLVAEPERRLVWTDGLGAGFRPKGTGSMTAELRVIPDGDGTLHRADVVHKDRADRDKHEKMGFLDGWGTVAAQLAEVAMTIPG